ncbi:hypothetical protein [Hoeflea sp. IMCC20628]|uniref:hypothetical protein n=1 Tax=Hoeflea sp. IMCC20628 TaxID=1620421 RepID=UPI00063A8F53|nr:hypothetical protein [Hoeflea sp. IMCC20628]
MSIKFKAIKYAPEFANEIGKFEVSFDGGEANTVPVDTTKPPEPIEADIDADDLRDLLEQELVEAISVDDGEEVERLAEELRLHLELWPSTKSPTRT